MHNYVTTNIFYTENNHPVKNSPDNNCCMETRRAPGVFETYSLRERGCQDKKKTGLVDKERHTHGHNQNKRTETRQIDTLYYVMTTEENISD